MKVFFNPRVFKFGYSKQRIFFCQTMYRVNFMWRTFCKRAEDSEELTEAEAEEWNEIEKEIEAEKTIYLTGEKDAVINFTTEAEEDEKK